MTDTGSGQGAAQLVVWPGVDIMLSTAEVANSEPIENGAEHPETGNGTANGALGKDVATVTANTAEVSNEHNTDNQSTAAEIYTAQSAANTQTLVPKEATTTETTPSTVTVSHISTSVEDNDDFTKITIISTETTVTETDEKAPGVTFSADTKDSSKVVLRNRKAVSWWKRFRRRVTRTSSIIYTAIVDKRKYRAIIWLLFALLFALIIAVGALSVFVYQYRKENMELQQQVYGYQEVDKCTREQVNLWDKTGGLISNITLECPYKQVGYRGNCDRRCEVFCDDFQ